MPLALRRKLVLLDSAFNRLLQLLRTGLSGKKMMISEGVPPVKELNALWEKTRTNEGYTLVRDGAYWTHRYFGHPLNKYITYSLYSADDFAGLVVFCVEGEDAVGSRRVRLMEWMLSPALNASSVFAGVIGKVMKGCFDYCITYCDSTDKDAQALRNNLFVQKYQVTMTFYRNTYCNPDSMNNMIRKFYMGNTDAA